MNKKISREFKTVNGQCYKIDHYYTLGGLNYFDYSNIARGYYVSVTPCKVHNYDNGCMSIETTAFTGYKHLLLEVKRASKKAEERAIKISEEGQWVEKLIQQLEMERGNEYVIQ